MNGTFYQNPTFPTNDEEEIKYISNDSKTIKYSIDEQGNIKNVLKMNEGNKIKAYVSYPNPSSWQSKIYDGILEQSGKDYLIIKDVKDRSWLLIRLNYLDYIEFEERINYDEN